MNEPTTADDPFLINPREKAAPERKRAPGVKAPRLVGDTVDLRGTGSPQESYPNAKPMPTPVAAPAPAPAPVVPTPVPGGPPAPPLAAAPSAATAPGPNPSAYAAPPPQAYPPHQTAQWKRSWKTTWARWGVAAGITWVLSGIFGFVLASAFVTGQSYEALGYSVGELSLGYALYVFFWGHWYDHVIAGAGKWGAFAVTVGTAGFLSLFGSLGVSWLPPGVYFLLAIAIASITFLTVTAVFKSSFKPPTA